MLSGTAEESRARPLGMQSRKARIWRILPVTPTLGFSPLPPIHSAHFERVLWVALACSPSHGRNDRYLREADIADRGLGRLDTMRKRT